LVTCTQRRFDGWQFRRQLGHSTLSSQSRQQMPRTSAFLGATRPHEWPWRDPFCDRGPRRGWTSSRVASGCTHVAAFDRPPFL